MAAKNEKSPQSTTAGFSATVSRSAGVSPASEEGETPALRGYSLAAVAGETPALRRRLL